MLQTKTVGKQFNICIPKDWEKYTIESLFKDYWKAPKKLVHELRMEKNVLINGQEANWTTHFQMGDNLSIPFFLPEPPIVQPTYMEIDILFEDDHLLIANKPAGMDTHPNSEKDHFSLLNGVAFHLQSKGELYYIKHIHRLDRDTTGAVIFAKHRMCGAILDRLLEERKIKRTYVALVEGKMKTSSGSISKPIGRDRHHPTRRRVSSTGQSAVTHYKVHTYNAKNNTTLISCQLDTGRTHQIRVHLSSIGHPLIGDSLYGSRIKQKRQALHALKVEFTHPFTEENIVCKAPFVDNPSIFPDMDV
ncbi:RluA family pseudouridine synthase [Robertmurraya sp. P23]|uniref:RluA family pseudouridine synthase n=1 Tax=Robertmurraya sp. P23 TaxID=3436931 RepID=UPI003D98AD9A